MNRKIRIGLLLSLLMVFISQYFEPCLGEEGTVSNASPACGVELLESHLPDGSVNQTYQCNLTFVNGGEQPCSGLYNLTFTGIRTWGYYQNTNRHSFLLNVSLGTGEVAEEHVRLQFRRYGPYRVTLDGEFLDYINVDYNLTYDQSMINYTKLMVTPVTVECGESVDVHLHIQNLDDRPRTAHFFLGLDKPPAPIAVLYRGGHGGEGYTERTIKLEPLQEYIYNTSFSTMWPGYYAIGVMVNGEDILSTGCSARHPIEVDALRIEPSTVDVDCTLTVSCNVSNTSDFFVFERVYLNLDGKYHETQTVELSAHETKEVIFVKENYSSETSGSTGQAEVFLMNSKKYLQGSFKLEDEDEKPDGNQLAVPTALVLIAAVFILIGMMKKR